MSSFWKPYTFTRYTADSYVKGKLVKGGIDSTFTVMISVQPLSAEEVQYLPEGRRVSSSFTIYCAKDTNLVTAEEESPNPPDTVELFGKVYEVNSLFNWQNEVISHQRYLVIEREK